MKSVRSVRIEITYLTKGVEKEKNKKIVGGRINERNKKKIVGTGGLDVKGVVCERLGWWQVESDFYFRSRECL